MEIWKGGHSWNGRKSVNTEDRKEWSFASTFWSNELENGIIMDDSKFAEYIPIKSN